MDRSFRPLRASARFVASSRWLCAITAISFQTYNPDPGDGQRLPLRTIVRRHGSGFLDLGTKGSGRTPWSRTADGRLTLKGGVREVLATS